MAPSFIASSEFDPSTQEVVSNDDLLTEILLRLPIVSLRTFKSISKRWLTLTTHPNFTFRRTQNPSDPPTGLFLRRLNVFEYDFVPLDPRIQPSSPLYIILTSTKTTIMQSCNGLLLCHAKPNYQLSVFNPSLNWFKAIPQSPYSKPMYGYGGFKLAFDPSISCYYKIVCGGVVFNGGNLGIQIQIYSSKTREWSVLGYDRRCIVFKGFKHGLYWNNAIHWINTRNRNWHTMLDINETNGTHSFKPRAQKAPNGKNMNTDQKLFESRGCLLLICSQKQPKKLNVYEMSEWESGWVMKYVVCLSEIVKMPSPSVRSESAKWFGSRVRSVVIGERDEDSFLVMEMRRKILRYSIGLRTFSRVYKLENSVIYSPDSFQFIASVVDAV